MRSNAGMTNRQGTSPPVRTLAWWLGWPQSSKFTTDVRAHRLSLCCYLSTIVGSLTRLRRLCHLCAKFFITCRTLANILILFAVWWLLHAGEMEIKVHAFLNSTRVVCERWASRAGFFTPDVHWQLAGWV